MALIKREGGCKVGWHTYDDKAEAEAAAVAARELAARMGESGYDFGWVSPGNIKEGTLDGQTVWTVTVP